MIRILLPMAGNSQFFDAPEYPYPLPLIEIFDKTIIERVIENLNEIKESRHFIFVVNESDCLKYHLDDTLKLLTREKCNVIQLKGKTKGAACSALMAVDHIENEDPLIIANSDQLFEKNILREAVQFFSEEGVDAGVVCFESIHPRWSYARLDGTGKIVETAEKRPLSKNAIAGFYFFRRGQDFVRAAMASIKKDSNINELYYISPILNEFILANKLVLSYPIENAKFHTFYTPKKIKEYEQAPLRERLK